VLELSTSFPETNVDKMKSIFVEDESEGEAEMKGEDVGMIECEGLVDIPLSVDFETEAVDDCEGKAELDAEVVGNEDGVFD